MRQKLNFKLINLNLDPKLIKQLDLLALQLDLDRTTLIRNFINEGMVKFKRTGNLIEFNNDDTDNNSINKAPDERRE